MKTNGKEKVGYEHTLFVSLLLFDFSLSVNIKVSVDSSLKK